jgi:glutamate synthase domain-containing protein 1
MMFVLRLSCIFARSQQKVTLPPAGQYATGIFFLDRELNKAQAAQQMFEELASECELKVSKRDL